MKKLISKVVALAILIFIGANIKAQDDKTITFGVKGGLNISNLIVTNSNYKAKVGFNIGSTVDYMLTPEWRLLSGLEYSLKGAKAVGSLNFGYLQLPIHAGYKLNLGSSKLIFRAGPYLAYALHGSSKSKYANVNIFEFDVYKRFDFGVGAGAGIEFGKLEFSMGYDLGMNNIFKKSNYLIAEESLYDSNSTAKNVNTYLTIGYKFK